MYRGYEEEVIEEYKRLASLQGIEIGENLSPVATQSPGKPNIIRFGKSDEYAHLSKKERRGLTKQMMSLHKALYEKSVFGKRGKGRR